MARTKTKPQLSEFEKEFIALQEITLEEINEKLDAASALLHEAEKLSEAHGIPFNTEISFINNTYTPDSFRKKYYENLTEEFLNNAGIYERYGSGWSHSQIC